MNREEEKRDQACQEEEREVGRDCEMLVKAELKKIANGPGSSLSVFVSLCSAKEYKEWWTTAVFGSTRQGTKSSLDALIWVSDGKERVKDLMRWKGVLEGKAKRRVECEQKEA